MDTSVKSSNANSDSQVSKEQYFRQHAEELQALKTRAAKLDVQVGLYFYLMLLTSDIY